MTWLERHNAFQEEMVVVFERLNAAAEAYSVAYRDDPEGKRFYDVACRLLAEDSPGTDPHRWTMGFSTTGPYVVGKTKAVVFQGPFQPAWMLYGAQARDAICVVDGTPA